MEDDRIYTTERVTLLGEVNIAPTVCQDFDLDQLINEHQIATYWEPDTEYEVGQIMMPPLRNGHRYQCVRRGTSAADMPELPLSRGGLVSDGDTLVWAEAGGYWPNVFDIEYILYDIWMHKAGQASTQVDATLAGGASAGTFSVKCSQQFRQCIEMAQRYAPLRF